MTDTVPARPDWASTLSGVVPAVRLAASSRALNGRARSLLCYLVDEIRTEQATHRATARLHSGALPRPSIGVRDLVLSVLAGEHSVEDEDQALVAFCETLASVASSDKVDSVRAAGLLSLLESMAVRAFGSQLVVATKQHLSAASVELAAVDPGGVDQGVRKHLEECDRCRALVSDYQATRRVTPLHQLPLAE